MYNIDYAKGIVHVSAGYNEQPAEFTFDEWMRISDEITAHEIAKSEYKLPGYDDIMDKLEKIHL